MLKNFYNYFTFFIFSCTFLFSQNLNIPGDGVPTSIQGCGDPFTLKIQVFGPVAAGDLLNVTMAPELWYDGNLINATESDVSDPHAPIFSLPELLTTSDNIIIEFDVQADCNSLADEIVTYTLDGTSITVDANLPTPDYAAFEILSVNPTTISLPKGGQGDFTLTITQEGDPNSYVTNMFIAITPGVDVSTISANVGTMVITGVVDTLHLNSTDIQAAGDADGILTQGETIDVTITVQLDDCPIGGTSVEFIAGYGCEGSTCISGNPGVGNISVPFGVPNLWTEVTSPGYPGFCVERPTTILFRNDGTGEGALYNLQLDFGFNTGGSSYDPRYYSTLSIYNLNVNGTTVPIIAGGPGLYQPWIFDFTSLTSDPDGPGVGLEDLDNDGFYDDLAVGEQFEAEFFIDMLIDDQTVSGEQCDVYHNGYRFSRWRERYVDACGAITERNIANNTGRGRFFLYGYYSTAFAGEIIGDLNLTDGDQFGLKIITGGTYLSIPESCPDGKYYVHITMPNDIVYDPSPIVSTGYFEEDDDLRGPVTFIGQTGNIATFEVPVFDRGYIVLPFMVDCQSGICFEVINLEYKLEVVCESNGCAFSHVFKCGYSESFTKTCPGICDCEGITTTKFSVDRITLGVVSDTDPTPVNPADVRTDRATECDSVRVIAHGVVGTDDIAEAYFVFEHGQIGTSNVFDDAQVFKLTFIDIETTSITICNDITSAYSRIAGATNEHLIDLTALTGAGGCLEGFTISTGDEIIVEMDLTVAESIPIDIEQVPTVIGKFRVVNNVMEIFECNLMIDRFTVVGNHNIVASGIQTVTMDYCTPFNYSINYYGTYRGGKIPFNQDFFPNEFRALHKIDRLDILFPKGLDISGDVEYRAEGNSSSPMILPSSNLTITRGYTATHDLYSFVNEGNWPVADFAYSHSSRYWFIFDLVPNCQFSPGTSFDWTILNTTEANFYCGTSARLATFSDWNKPLIYHEPTYDVTTTTSTVTTLTNAVEWSFSVNNTTPAQATIPLMWVALESPTGGVLPYELYDVTNGTTIPLVGYGAGKWWAQLGDLPGGSRDFIIRSNFTTCGEDNLLLYVSQNCAGYPIDPDQGYQYADGSFYNCMADPIELTVIPQDPYPQIASNIGGFYDLCTPIPVALSCNNGANGTAYDPQIVVTLPTGLIFDNTSVTFTYDGTTYTVPPSLITGTNPYTFDISSSSIPSNPFDPTNPSATNWPGTDINNPNPNVFEVNFEMTTDCDFTSGSRIVYEVESYKGCGERYPTIFNQNRERSNRIRINGEPTGHQYAIEVSGTGEPIVCNTAGAITVTITNQGTDTEDIESIIVKIPEDFQYVAGSSPQGEPTITTEPGFVILTWPMPVGIPAGQTINLEYEINFVGDVAALPCQYTAQMDVSTAISSEIACGTDVCEINFITEGTTAELTIQKTEITVVGSNLVSTAKGGGLYDISSYYTLTNTGTVSTVYPVTVQIFHDDNGNGEYDSGEPILDSFTTPGPMAASEVVTGTWGPFEVDLNTYTLERIMYVVDNTAQVNPCLCGDSESPVPVELTSFNAIATFTGVQLSWSTESEVENLGFIVERKANNTDYIEIAGYKTNDNLLGQGTTSSSTSYEYNDNLVEANTTYEYRLADVDYNGVITYHSTRQVTVEMAPLAKVEAFTVLPAYPNPFNPSTTIRYGTKIEGRVLVEIYDITGKLITKLVNEEQSQGWHSVVWNGTNNHGEQVPAGIYLIKIESDNKVKTNKLMLLR